MEPLKVLILCRHSDAEEKNKKGDFYRSLTKEGKEKAIKTAKWIKEQNIQINKTICSDSIRTKETFELFNEILLQDIPVKFENKIYENNYMDINRCIMKEESELDAILLIGHNPSMSHLAAQYADIYRFPTAGCVILKFEAETWSQIDSLFLKEASRNFDN